jgi:hypothetical protein
MGQAAQLGNSACPSMTRPASIAGAAYIDATRGDLIRYTLMYYKMKYYTIVSILICRGLAVSFLVRLTVSTPLL